MIQDRGLIFLCFLGSAVSVCMNGWIRQYDSCYLFEDLLPKNWSDARQYCNSKADGAHLVSVESGDENKFIIHELTKMHPGTELQFWTSGNDIDTEGQWIWQNTQSGYEVSFWYPGEPNSNAGPEDCMSFYTRYRFAWNDEHCDRQMAFICEIEDPSGGEIVG